MPLPLAAVVWTGVRWAAKKGIKKAAKRVVKRTKKTPKPSSKATQKPLRSRGTSRATPKGKRKQSMYTRTKGLSSEYGKRGGVTKSMAKSKNGKIKVAKPQKRYKEKKMVQEFTSEYKPLKGRALIRHLNRKHKKPTKYGTRTHSTTIRRGKGPTSEPGGLKVFDKNFRALKKNSYKYY